jgi:hypothetical protein
VLIGAVLALLAGAVPAGAAPAGAVAAGARAAHTGVTPTPQPATRRVAPAGSPATPSSPGRGGGGRPGTSGFGLVVLAVLVGAGLYLTARLRRRR